MRIAGQEQLAELFGVAPKTIGEWQEQGLPIAARGRRGIASQYDSAACIRWLVEREVRKVQGEPPRDRLARVQAEQIEMAIAKERRVLIAADSVEPLIRSACIAAREYLQREKKRLAMRLDRTTSRKERERVIGEIHDAFLRKLAAWRGDPVEDEAA